MPEYGTFFILATPLGNLEDISLRGLKVLRMAELVAAEDTRRTRKLLSHYDIKTTLISYREQNHKQVLPKILEILTNGKDVALVTDAGTPGVSDPGSLAVREAAERGIPVLPVPGPSAVSTALSVSGLPADSFFFVGFLPSRKTARLALLEKLKKLPHTIVCFEAPHRLVESLKDLAGVFGDRPAVLCREMTKMNEEFIRAGLRELAAAVGGRSAGPRGEITLVVAGADESGGSDLTIEELTDIIKGDERSVREIVADLIRLTSLSRSELYRLVLKVTGRG